MQATLLSIAIALILALVTALVGPHFVDWNKYRAEFETQASRMTGLQVRVAGPIDARLLPTPSLNLSRIDIARGDEAGTLRARRLSIEFSLGSLVRGEFKATDVILEGAEIAISLDRNGRLEWPAPSVGFDPEAISIERLDIRDSRALLADAASGYGVVLDKLDFQGELRTLSAVKGQGSFYADGQHYPYRIAASRVGDGRVRVRLNIDPIDRPLIADTEGFLSVENGSPHFVGSATLARPLTRAPAGSHAEILEPWRLTAKIDGNSTRAVVEQIEFQYGPDERPIRLRGDALINFGASPRFTGVLSSPQIDLDRILALPEPQRHRPLAAIKTFADYFAGSQRLPIPVSLGVSIESLTLAGATLQRVSGDFMSERNGWNIEKLELRVPGLSQLAVSGRLGVADGVSFAGRARLESKDPRTLIAWLTDRPEDQITAAASLSVDGDFKLSSDEIAIDRLRAALDRMSVEGRLAYSWGTGARPPRIEAVVSAPDIDLDRAHGLLQGLFDGSVFEMPREGLLAARIDRATLAGVEARGADVNVRFDANGLNIERLAIGDFGGVSLAVSGNIDTRAHAPGGAVKLELDARRLDGVATLLERLSPWAAAEIRRNAGRVAPAKLSASLVVSAADASASESNGRFRVDGSAGALRVALQGDVNANSADLTLAGLARLRSARLDLGGDIETSDGTVLVGLLGLERFITVDQGAGHVTASARGALDGDMAVDGRVVAFGFDASAKGSLRLTGSRGPTADMEMKVAHANVRSPRSTAQPDEWIPASGSARLALAEGNISLSDLAGTVAGTDINGRVTVSFADPVSVTGELSLGALHLPATVATVIGLPHVGSGSWPSEPFERGLIGAVEGSLKLRIGRVALSSQLGIANMRSVLQFGRDSFAIEEIDGSIAGGRVAGSISFERGVDGLSVDTHVRFAGANLADLLPGDGALAGRATIDLDLQGTGRSPIALIGALKGEGTFTVQDGQIMRLDPAAFAAVIRSIDDGLPIDALRIGERTEAALGNGALNVALAQGEIAVAAGQLRLANMAIRAKGAELGVTLGLDLSGNAIDARLVMSGAPGSGALEGIRPEIALILRGPFDAPKRTLSVAAFTNWLALRAIEEKDKRIDALQSGREVPVPPATPAPPPDTPPVKTPPARTPSVTPAPDKVTPAAPQPKAVPRPPAAKAAPPTDIRPPAAVRPQTSPTQAQPPQRPTSRSWLENLLGP